MNLKIYYAHSKRIYGTPREKSEREFLEQHFKEVLCPNRDMGEKGSIEPYLRAIETVEAVVCSEYKDHIGRGVFDEITFAMNKKMAVYCLREIEAMKRALIKVASAAIVDANDWAVRYAKVQLTEEVLPVNQTDFITRPSPAFFCRRP